LVDYTNFSSGHSGSKSTDQRTYVGKNVGDVSYSTGDIELGWAGVDHMNAVYYRQTAIAASAYAVCGRMALHELFNIGKWRGFTGASCPYHLNVPYSKLAAIHNIALERGGGLMSGGAISTLSLLYWTWCLFHNNEVIETAKVLHVGLEN